METLKTALFSEDGVHAYAIIDGASCEELLGKLDECQPEHLCLYAGELEPGVAECAPYLVRLEPNADFTQWLIGEGWGNHWAIFFNTPAETRTLRKHFRSFLLVKDPDNKTLYFRYYDPRVLRVFLPTCESAELAQIFGPVSRYLLESAEGALLVSTPQEVLKQWPS